MHNLINGFSILYLIHTEANLLCAYCVVNISSHSLPSFVFVFLYR